MYLFTAAKEFLLGHREDYPPARQATAIELHMSNRFCTELLLKASDLTIFGIETDFAHCM